MRNRSIIIGLAKGASATENFAAEELAKYLKRIAGVETRMVSLEDYPAPDFAVGRAAAEALALPEDIRFIGKDADAREAFIAVERNGTVVLAGNRGRTTLYSVYHLLEKLGARWVYPGERGTNLPALEAMDLTSLNEREEANFALRGIDFDITSFLLTKGEEAQRRWVKEILEETDWAAKNKVNSLCLIIALRFNDYLDNPLEAFWQKYKGQIVEAVEKRDLILEFGGHVLPPLIPTSLFDRDERLFRMKSGKRMKTGNFCVSYPKTLELLRRNAADYFSRHEEVDIFRVWPEDVLAGSWCSCPDCAKLSVYEQSYTATTALSETLAEKYPKKRVDFLSYHDTVEPKGDVHPRKNVLLAYAPRERCYRHSINDPSCERNADYDRHLLANHRTFGNNVYVFEYYADTILYRSLFVPLSKTISADLEYLHDTGVDKAQILLFGAHSFWLHGLNLYVFARKSWDVAVSVDALKKEYTATLFPSAPQLFLELLDKAERSVPAALEFTCENIGEKNRQRMYHNIEDAERQLAECEKLAQKMEAETKSAREKRFADALRSAIQYTRTTLSSGLLSSLTIPLLEGRAEGLTRPLTDKQVQDFMQVLQGVKEGLTEGNQILQRVDEEFLGAWGKIGRPDINKWMLEGLERLAKRLLEGKDLWEAISEESG